MCGWCYLKCHKSIINTEWEALRRETFTPAPLKLLWWLTQFLSSNCIPRMMHGDGCISRGEERERWRLRGKCMSVCLCTFCLLSFLLLKIISLKAEYVGAGGQEFYNLKKIWQITKALFLMTCIKNLLPAEVNSLQLRQTQVPVFFLKQKQHLKMWVYLGLKREKKEQLL